MDTATTEFHYDYRARAHTPKNPCCLLLSLPPISRDRYYESSKRLAEWKAAGWGMAIKLITP